MRGLSNATETDTYYIEHFGCNQLEMGKYVSADGNFINVIGNDEMTLLVVDIRDKTTKLTHNNTNAEGCIRYIHAEC